MTDQPKTKQQLIEALRTANDQLRQEIARREEAETALNRSEAKYRAVVTQSTECIFLIDAQTGQILEANLAFQRLLGYDAAEFLGLTLYDFVTHDRAEIDQNMERIRKKGYHSMGERRYRRKDGTLLDVEVSANLISFEDRQVISVVSHDITDRKRDKQTLEEHKERLQAFANALPDLAFILDEEGCYVEVLATQAELLYSSADHLRGSYLHNRLPKKDADLFLRIIRETIETESPQILEYELEVKAGWRWFEARTFPMKSTTEKKRLVVWISRDVTERKRAEQAMHESEAKFRTLAEMSSAAIIMYRGTQMIYVNPAAERITGYTEAELLSKTFWEVIHPDFREMIKERGLARQQGKPIPNRYEVKILTKKAEARWVDAAMGMTEFKGKPVVIGTAFDITDRKRAEAEREELLNAEREQRLLAETLGEVFLALAAQTRREAVLDEILRQVRRVVSKYPASIVLLENGSLNIVRWQGYQAVGMDEFIAGLKQPLADFPIDARVIRTGQPLLIPNTHQNTEWVTLEPSTWIKSTAIVPICLQKKVLGLLRLDSNIPDSFSTQDIERLQPLANAAAIALENARLYDQTRQELTERKQAQKEIVELNDRLLALRHAGATVASSLDLNYVLKTVTWEMINLLKAESCAISEWDQTANVVRVMAEDSISDSWEGDPPEWVHDLADYPLTKKVLVERLPQQLTVSQPDVDPAELGYMQENNIATLLMLPTEFQDRVVGLVEVMDSRLERTFTVEEVGLAQYLANQAATAIENARLFHQARQEIEERKEIEQRLRRMANRNQAILDAIPDSMFYLNRAGQLLGYSKAEQDGLWLDYVDKTLIGQKLTTALELPDDLANQFQHCIDQTLTSGRVQIFEFQHSSIVGKQDAEARLVVSGSDEVLVIIRNITERKQAERQVIRTERLTALGKLAATLAHEINNPLQAIQSNLDLTLDFPLEPGETEAYLEVIREEITRLRDIAQNVLNFANPRVEPRREVFVAELVDQVLMLTKKRLEHHGVKVIKDWRDIPAVMAAPHQLTQVFLNLIINATEALPPHGELHISIYPEAEHVAVSFTNNGPIIAPEILPHIFEPFFTTKPEGSGLGLWVSHSLVKQHAGLLTVENLSDQQGVIFTVKLPAISSKNRD